MRKMNAEPSNSRPLSPYHRPTCLHLHPATHAQATPHLRTFAIALAYISPNFYGEPATPLRSFTHHPRTYHIISQHQRAHRSAPSPMLLRTFFPNFYGETAPPLRIFTHHPRTNPPTAAHLHPYFHAPSCPFLLRMRNGAPMPSERLYGGIREKSIGHPRKVYRVFRKSL